MKNLFWIGVYPGLTDEMLQYTIKTLSNTVKPSQRKKHKHMKK